jgi:hypothetical protein
MVHGWLTADQTNDSDSNGRLVDDRDDLRWRRAGARSGAFRADGGVGGDPGDFLGMMVGGLCLAAGALVANWRLPNGLACSSRGEVATGGTFFD